MLPADEGVYETVLTYHRMLSYVTIKFVTIILLIASAIFGLVHQAIVLNVARRIKWKNLPCQWRVKALTLTKTLFQSDRKTLLVINTLHCNGALKRIRSTQQPWIALLLQPLNCIAFAGRPFLSSHVRCRWRLRGRYQAEEKQCLY